VLVNNILQDKDLQVFLKLLTTKTTGIYNFLGNNIRYSTFDKKLHVGTPCQVVILQLPLIYVVSLFPQNQNLQPQKNKPINPQNPSSRTETPANTFSSVPHHNKSFSHPACCEIFLYFCNSGWTKLQMKTLYQHFVPDRYEK